jgi:DNA-binding GntR family transcriptional regulator
MREVLIQLAAQGLVERHPVHGFRIAPVTADELLDLVRTLVWLEGIGLRESILAGDKHWEEGLLAAARTLSLCARPPATPTDKELSSWEEHLLDYHDALIAGCRSSILLEQCRSLSRRLLRYRNLSAHTADATLERTCCKELRTAALERRADVASKHLGAYYRLVTDAVLASGVIK